MAPPCRTTRFGLLALALLPAESIWQIVSYLRSLEPPRGTLSTTAW